MTMIIFLCVDIKSTKVKSWLLCHSSKNLKQMTYSGYARTSWYVTEIPGVIILSTVRLQSECVVAHVTSGVIASVLPVQHAPIITRQARTYLIPFMSGTEYTSRDQYFAPRAKLTLPMTKQQRERSKQDGEDIVARKRTDSPFSL